MSPFSGRRNSTNQRSDISASRAKRSWGGDFTRRGAIGLAALLPAALSLTPASKVSHYIRNSPVRSYNQLHNSLAVMDCLYSCLVLHAAHDCCAGRRLTPDPSSACLVLIAHTRRRR